MILDAIASLIGEIFSGNALAELIFGGPALLASLFH
jgi:hypothetical protein